MSYPELSRVKREALYELMSEATADANGHDEAVMGFVDLMDENVAAPFEAKVAGETISVTGFVESEHSTVQALCRRGGKEYKIDLASIEWPMPPPKGFDYVLAYIEWERVQ